MPNPTYRNQLHVSEVYPLISRAFPKNGPRGPRLKKWTELSGPRCAWPKCPWNRKKQSSETATLKNVKSITKKFVFALSAHVHILRTSVFECGLSEITFVFVSFFFIYYFFVVNMLAIFSLFFYLLILVF